MTENATPAGLGLSEGLGLAPTARVVPLEYTPSVRLEWASTQAAHNAQPGPLYAQAALDAALARWPRDCRLCAHYRDGLTHAAHCVSVLRCEDSSAYRATQLVQLWEKRPAEPAPF